MDGLEDMRIIAAAQSPTQPPPSQPPSKAVTPNAHGDLSHQLAGCGRGRGTRVVPG
jgi:hypothetical protein